MVARRDGFVRRNRWFVVVAALTALFGVSQAMALGLSPVAAMLLPPAYLTVACINRLLADKAKTSDMKAQGYWKPVGASLIMTVIAAGSVLTALISGGWTGNLSGTLYFGTILLEYFAVLVYLKW